MQVVLGRQREVIVPGVLCVDRGNWEQERDIFLYRVFAFEYGRRILQNALFCEKGFGKNHALFLHVTYKDVDRFRKKSVHE